VKTRPLVQTMQTPVRDVGSTSNGHGERWGRFIETRPPPPTSLSTFTIIPLPQLPPAAPMRRFVSP
jgi:hypothetical protein